MFIKVKIMGVLNEKRCKQRIVVFLLKLNSYFNFIINNSHLKR